LDFDVIMIVGAAFVAVTATAIVAGQAFVNRAQLSRRLMAGAAAPEVKQRQEARRQEVELTTKATESRLGIEGDVRLKLRRELVRAGFFGPEAVKYFMIWRLCAILILPAAALAATQAPGVPEMSARSVLAAVTVGGLLGIFGPGAYLSRRRNRLIREYRAIFPDLLDLLIVCVSAGLSIEAAIDRVRLQLGKRSPALGYNLTLLGAEMRAGRSVVDALNSMADRLSLDEATSFVAVLRHSVELGADISESLRVFSDEMRDKRILRAEEVANMVPAKIVVPLTVGIFPVIMVIMVVPPALRLITAMKWG